MEKEENVEKETIINTRINSEKWSFECFFSKSGSSSVSAVSRASAKIVADWL